MLFYVLIVCTATLPPGVNPIAGDKYIYRSQSTQTGRETGFGDSITVWVEVSSFVSPR